MKYLKLISIFALIFTSGIYAAGQAIAPEDVELNWPIIAAETADMIDIGQEFLAAFRAKRAYIQGLTEYTQAELEQVDLLDERVEASMNEFVDFGELVRGSDGKLITRWLHPCILLHRGLEIELACRKLFVLRIKIIVEIYSMIELIRNSYFNSGSSLAFDSLSDYLEVTTQLTRAQIQRIHQNKSAINELLVKLDRFFSILDTLDQNACGEL